MRISRLEDSAPELNGDLNELAPLRHLARAMTVVDFSMKYDEPIRLWGKPSMYACVDVHGVSYLWRLTDGQYDGWDRLETVNV